MNRRISSNDEEGFLMGGRANKGMEPRAATGARATESRRRRNSMLVLAAARDSFRKLSPNKMVKSPVMFVVYLGAIVVTVLFVLSLLGEQDAPTGFVLAIAVWLWITVLFANFSEALSEGRGKAQAESLRRSRKEVTAKRLKDVGRKDLYGLVDASTLKKGDIVLVEAGDTIPLDGEVIEGVASVDESAVTGESAPVIRESGGDRNAVTGGTSVLSDWIVVRLTAEPGKSFLDRMISMIEGANRQKTPNEIALNVLLAALTIIFLVVVATLFPFSVFSVRENAGSAGISITALVALLVCLAPTTIGALVSTIGIAGMSRLGQARVVAMSGRAVEAAGDVNVLLLDKTGTITLGNRQAEELIPADGVPVHELAEAAMAASFADETPEGRSIVTLARHKYGLRHPPQNIRGAQFVGFSARTRMSGVNFGSHELRKGATDAIEQFVKRRGGSVAPEVATAVAQIARNGGTPLVVAQDERVLGVIHLKDIVKSGIRERFDDLRAMGIRTVMITGDNAITAAAIAAEAGVDDFLAEATPEAKLDLIRDHQAKGYMVAMTGDGTNDAPALAQADVAVAMNSGTQAAKEAGNMVDLDSNPTKLLEIVRIGKQLLITRGALTTFSVANDVAKYFAILPAMFAPVFPALNMLNIMHLHTPRSAILAAVIFNALIILALIPLALRGVRYHALSAAALLRRNLLIYGVGGLIVPFIGIKLIDMVLALLHLA